jgi:hypothetical protein
MLDETEWQELTPFLDSHVKAIQAYRQKTGLGIREAREHMADEACAAYQRLTGYRETNYLAIYHHRLSGYGTPCARCGRLLRTPRASFCAECGYRPTSQLIA